MKIDFHLEYFAREGERMYLCADDGRRTGMNCAGGVWRCDMETAGSGMRYRYCLCDAGGAPLRMETGPEHVLEPVPSADRMAVYDSWSDRTADDAFRSSFFTEAVFRRGDVGRRVAAGGERVPAAWVAGRLLLRAEAPSLGPDEVLAVVGASAELGVWRTERAVRMKSEGGVAWSAVLPACDHPVAYKLVVLDAAAGALRCWEEGADRVLPPCPADGRTAVAVCGVRLRDGRARWRGAGVAVPLFSLRSGKDWGVGEFGDIAALADWAADAGMCVIQLLPVNDTSVTGTWRDSYPYNPVSCFALHPLYADCAAAAEACGAVCTTAEAAALRAIAEECAPRGAELNRLPEVDYEGVMALKNGALRRMYDVCGAAVMASEAYRAFAERNRGWLLPYCVFCAAREDAPASAGGARRPTVPYDAAWAEEYARRHARGTGYYGFVQYILDMQLREACDHARSRGVALKGDIPIGVSPDGADVWCRPGEFNLAMSAGAPPDAFSADGQNWGFPTYDWRRMAADGYSWWRSRLGKMSEYFDAYRLDHILGFFRIWEIPRDGAGAVMGHFNPSLPMSPQEIECYGFRFDAARHAVRDLSSTDTLFIEDAERAGLYFPRMEGCDTDMFRALDTADREAYRRLYDDFYYRRHDAFWRRAAREKLPALTGATRMLACGEDLGMIPACVPDVMREENILSLEIERMPKRAGEAFADVSRYPYLSVASTSTHDMSTLRGWWREEPEAAQRYYNEVLGLAGEAPAECTGAVAALAVERHMRSSSMLAVLPLQDWLAADEELRWRDPDAERINVPSDPNRYWRYRMHITLERLRASEGFTALVRRLTALRRG